MLSGNTGQRVRRPGEKGLDSGPRALRAGLGAPGGLDGNTHTVHSGQRGPASGEAGLSPPEQGERRRPTCGPAAAAPRPMEAREGTPGCPVLLGRAGPP